MAKVVVGKTAFGAAAVRVLRQVIVATLRGDNRTVVNRLRPGVAGVERKVFVAAVLEGRLQAVVRRLPVRRFMTDAAEIWVSDDRIRREEFTAVRLDGRDRLILVYQSDFMQPALPDKGDGQRSALHHLALNAEVGVQ